ncbi:MAG TPA: hypothetical protein VM597_09530 [Gemmataceae bacterium]|jgi:hypothetical protein|nr:hypothetical protein [Gemmataceae bacterium]
MDACVPVALNGTEAWELVGESDVGLRIRLSADDWERANLCLGQRVLVRRPGGEARLFVADVDEAPPLVWATFAERLLVEA